MSLYRFLLSVVAVTPPPFHALNLREVQFTHRVQTRIYCSTECTKYITRQKRVPTPG